MQLVPEADFQVVKDEGVTKTSHLHLISKRRMVKPYLNAPMRLHGVVLNYLNTATNLHFFIDYNVTCRGVSLTKIVGSGFD
jgi:hypothetical protein